MRFSLDVLCSFETHFQLFDFKQYRCIYFLVVKQPCDIVVSLLEVYVRILTNQIISISNDLLCLRGEYGRSTFREKRNLFLDNGISFIRGFNFDMCRL